MLRAKLILLPHSDHTYNNCVKLKVKLLYMLLRIVIWIGVSRDGSTTKYVNKNSRPRDNYYIPTSVINHDQSVTP